MSQLASDLLFSVYAHGDIEPSNPAMELAASRRTIQLSIKFNPSIRADTPWLAAAHFVLISYQVIVHRCASGLRSALPLPLRGGNRYD